MPAPLNQRHQSVESFRCEGNLLTVAKQLSLGRVQLERAELVQMLLFIAHLRLRDFSEINFIRGRLELYVPDPPRVVTRTAEDKVAAIRSTLEVGDGDSTPVSYTHLRAHETPE